ncbi:MAG: choloylglycine hydrolase family protein [Lachnospiraceae bacterium]|nr:choloylglycine hydrolase family protein [Lachnospiraceae bacterium]
MCTAATYLTKDFYFGRTLDNTLSYNEEVVVTPRNYPFHFKKVESMQTHYAMIGVACVMKDYPLYYDAINEKGLGMAGLNFVGNAVYGKEEKGKCNISQFEFIPWILGQCSCVKEARELIERMNLIELSFDDSLPIAQLHWIIADRNEAITVESVKDGIKVYDNTVGVLTNNPTFPEQMFSLNNYMAISPKQPQNCFCDKLSLQTYSMGMGTIGLPGGLASQPRFVRAVFTKMNSVSGDSENESVNQFFHILNSVEQQKGCCETAEGSLKYTIYTSCCNVDKGIFYYTTYDNHQICAVDMYREDLEKSGLVRYPVINEEQILMQN